MNELGLAAVEREDDQAAERLFREAIAADRSSVAAHNNLGILLQRQGRFYDAAQAYARAIRLNHRAIEPLTNLAALYESIGWTAEACRAYEGVLSVDPRNAVAHERLNRLGTSSQCDDGRGKSIEQEAFGDDPIHATRTGLSRNRQSTAVVTETR